MCGASVGLERLGLARLGLGRMQIGSRYIYKSFGGKNGDDDVATLYQCTSRNIVKISCETKVWLILILMITKQGLVLMIIFQV